MPVSPEEQALWDAPADEFEAKVLEEIDRQPRNLGCLAMMRNVAWGRSQSMYRTQEEKLPFNALYDTLEAVLQQPEHSTVVRAGQQR